MVRFLGGAIVSCLRVVDELGLMEVLMKSDGGEVVVDCCRLIFDVGNRRIIFFLRIFCNV